MIDSHTNYVYVSSDFALIANWEVRMFRSLATVAALVAGAALSSPAGAQSFSPAPGTYVLSGPVTISSTFSSTCTVTINIAVNAAGAATVTSRFLTGGSGCGTLVAPYGTWTVAPGPGLGSVTMTMGFYPAHNCYGVVQAPLTVTAMYSRLDLPFTYLPIPGQGQNGCAITGSSTLYSNVPLSVVP